MNAHYLTLTAFSDWQQKLYDIFVEGDRYKLLIEGLGNTVKITLGALCIGVVIGMLIAVVKYLAEDVPALRPLETLCNCYVTVIRGIPVVVLLLIFYYAIFPSLPGVPVAILTFGINSGAYMAEVVRSGINAVDVGQMEAGCSLGMSRIQAMRVVIFPQAIRYILPAIGNEMIALLKETSVAGYVAIVDLTRGGNLIRNNSFNQFYPLLIVALTYLIMVILLTWLLGKLERRLAKGVKR